VSIEEFVERHISPLRFNYIPRLIPRCDQFEDLSTPASFVEDNFKDPRNQRFWMLLEAYSEEIMNSSLNQRLKKLPVSPQMYCLDQGNPEDVPVDMLVGKISRFAHVKDVVRVGIADLKRRIDEGENLSADHIKYTVRTLLLHDTANLAQCHLSQDSLDFDPDMLNIVIASQPEIARIDNKFGFDTKKANVALCPPYIFSMTPKERSDFYGSMIDRLLRDTGEDLPIVLNCSLDLTAESPDHVLFEEPTLIKAASIAHEIYDIAYSRTDASNRAHEEHQAVSCLKNGIIHGKPKTIKRVEFAELPQTLRRDLDRNGSAPSGVLRITKLNEWVLLLEDKGSDQIIRAIGTSEEGLKKVKGHKSMIRYQETLRAISPREDLGFYCTDLDAFLRTILSLGDDQTHKIASKLGLLSLNVIKRANKDANVPFSIQAFGVHQDCVDRYLPHHRRAVEGGINNYYENLVLIDPHSTVAGVDWNSPEGPELSKIREFFKKASRIAQNFEMFLRHEFGSDEIEIIFGEAPSVSKKFDLVLDAQALKQLRERIMGDSEIYISPHSVYISRRSRKKEDRFSIGLRLNLTLDPGTTRSELSDRVNRTTRVQLLERMHTGFIIGMRTDQREFVLEYIHKLRDPLMELLRDTDFLKNEGRQYRARLPARAVFSPDWY